MPEKALQPSEKIPTFSTLDHNGAKVGNADFKGKWTVLYTYPKDMTPGCTTEARDFQANLAKFGKLGAQVFGLSADSPERHCKFIAKESLSFRLLSDAEHTLIEALGAWQMKTFMGRKAMGIVRSTWIVNPQGKVVATWSPVKVANHVQEVLARLQELQ